MSDFFFSQSPLLSATSLLYHTRFGLSRAFLKVFCLFSTACLSCDRCRLSATFILYHFQFALSSGFWNFFKFFQPLLQLAFSNAVFPTALVLYHILTSLSSPFSTLLPFSAFATKNISQTLFLFTVLYDPISKQLNDNRFFTFIHFPTSFILSSILYITDSNILSSRPTSSCNKTSAQAQHRISVALIVKKAVTLRENPEMRQPCCFSRLFLFALPAFNEQPGKKKPKEVLRGRKKRKKTSWRNRKSELPQLGSNQRHRG